uniref:Uridine phosphorylase 1 n=1 Tax=Cyprinus carpio carpio TaxID=630221 RepID=A0A8C1ERM7_CYPCA
MNVLEMTETEAGRCVRENSCWPLLCLSFSSERVSFLSGNCFYCGQDNIIKVEHFYEILHLQSTSAQPKKKAERICYTRDFLIKLASCPMAKMKPEFLPEHPIVLEKGRTNDVPRYFITNYNNNEDLAD